MFFNSIKQHLHTHNKRARSAWVHRSTTMVDEDYIKFHLFHDQTVVESTIGSDEISLGL